jgi:hypothetical protein
MRKDSGRRYSLIWRTRGGGVAPGVDFQVAIAVGMDVTVPMCKLGLSSWAELAARAAIPSVSQVPERVLRNT